MRKLLVSCLILVLVAGMIPFPYIPQAEAADAYDELRLKYRERLTAGTLNMSDPYTADKVAAIESEATQFWTSQNLDGVWDDYAGLSQTNLAYTAYMYRRLNTMALAWAMPDSQLHQDPDLLDDIIQGMDYLYANRYNESTVRFGNWWWWEIGTPFEINDLVVLLYDELTSTQIANYMNAVYQFVPGPIRTGANLTDACKILILSGIINKDGNRIQAASNALSDVFPYVATLDGFYEDGSFIQHELLPYAGAYGAVLLSSLGLSLNLLGGTAWDNTDPEKANVYGWIFETFEQAMQDGTFMQAFMGRTHSRFANTADILAAINTISQMTGNPYAAEMRGLIKYHVLAVGGNEIYSKLPLYTYTQIKAIMDDANTSPRPAPQGNYTFYNQDVTVQRGPDWTFAVRNHSSRIANFESSDVANVEPWYQGDGVTYLYNDPKDYVDYYLTTVDNHRLPGITTEIDRTREASSASHMLQGFRSERDFVGGVQLNGLYGVTSMDFKQHNYSNMDVEAKKSWFMFDDEIVAIGSGITSTSGRTVETIIDNRAIDSDGLNDLTVDGTVKSAADGWSETMSGTDWIHLEGAGGYYFPGGETVYGLREQRARAERELNRNAYPRYSEFDSPYLNLNWQWIRENIANWELRDTGTTAGKLVIDTEDGTLEEAVNTARNILVLAEPDGNYYFTATLAFNPTADKQEAGLMLYLDDDNYVTVSRARTSSGTVLKASYESGGTIETHSVADTWGSTVYLKLSRDGDRVSLYAGGDGVNWGSAIYTYEPDFAGSNELQLGLYAWNGHATGAPGVEAAFDRFDTLQTNHHLTLLKNHGTNPTDQTYAYTLLPNMTSGETAAYAATPDIAIVKQTEAVHAVKDDTLGLLGAVFWDAAGGEADYVTARQAGSVMVKDSGSSLQVAVADPTQKQQKVVVELNRTGTGVVSRDPEVTVVQLAPTIILEVDTSGSPGKSFQAELTYNSGASALPPNAPAGVIATYNHVGHSNQLSWNSVAGAASYRVYRSLTSGQGEMLVASGLTQTAYNDQAAGYAPYFYRITAVNANGESSLSGEVRVDREITYKLRPVEDTYVRDGAYSSESYGDDPLLVVKETNSSGFTRRAYLKFDLSGIDADEIVSATLRMNGKVIDGASAHLMAYGVADDNWTESSLNWANKPAFADLQSSLSVLVPGYRWQEMNVTPFVQSQSAGDQTASIGLKINVPATGGFSLESMEGGVRPYLEVKTRKDAPLVPSADTYVRDGTYSADNFGTGTTLVVKKSGSAGFSRQSFLQFDLEHLSGKMIVSAKLHLYGALEIGATTASDVEAYGVAADNWTEHGLNWNGKPGLDSLQSTVNMSSTTNAWHEFDVTGFIQSQAAGDGLATIGLRSLGTYGSIFSSKEGANKPYLELELGQTVKVDAADDAYIRSGSFAATNFGSEPDLVLRKGSADYYRESLLKFDLGNVPAGQVHSATLYLYGYTTGGGTETVELREMASDTWDEDTIVWNNRPAIGSLIGSSTVNSTLEYKAFDITSYVAGQFSGDQVVSLQANITGSGYTTFHSKEGTYKPYLLLVMVP